MRKKLSFFKHWVKSPLKTGAIAPSSIFLARQMLKGIDLSSANVVVELGPGTGVFSNEIIKQMPQKSTFIILEFSEQLANQLKKQFPNAIIICDCASNLGKHLKNMNIEKVDYIISGLPWTLFSSALQDKILLQIKSHLKHGGIFVTFVYMHGIHFFKLGKKFELKLNKELGPISKSKPIWLNLPPASVWSWKRPNL